MLVEKGECGGIHRPARSLSVPSQLDSLAASVHLAESLQAMLAHTLLSPSVATSARDVAPTRRSRRAGAKPALASPMQPERQRSGPSLGARVEPGDSLGNRGGMARNLSCPHLKSQACTMRFPRDAFGIQQHLPGAFPAAAAAAAREGNVLIPPPSPVGPALPFQPILEVAPLPGGSSSPEVGDDGGGAEEMDVHQGGEVPFDPHLTLDMALARSASLAGATAWGREASRAGRAEGEVSVPLFAMGAGQGAPHTSTGRTTPGRRRRSYDAVDTPPPARKQRRSREDEVHPSMEPGASVQVGSAVVRSAPQSPRGRVDALSILFDANLRAPLEPLDGERAQGPSRTAATRQREEVSAPPPAARQSPKRRVPHPPRPPHQRQHHQHTRQGADKPEAPPSLGACMLPNSLSMASGGIVSPASPSLLSGGLFVTHAASITRTAAVTSSQHASGGSAADPAHAATRRAQASPVPDDGDPHALAVGSGSWGGAFGAAPPALLDEPLGRDMSQSSHASSAATRLGAMQHVGEAQGGTGRADKAAACPNIPPSPARSISIVRESPIFKCASPSEQPKRPVTVPTVFQWLGPGREVFIVGSFNNWAERIPMRAAPDRADFFVVLALAPGIHLYRFVVDGQWSTAREQRLAEPDPGASASEPATHEVEILDPEEDELEAGDPFATTPPAHKLSPPAQRRFGAPGDSPDAAMRARRSSLGSMEWTQDESRSMASLQRQPPPLPVMLQPMAKMFVMGAPPKGGRREAPPHARLGHLLCDLPQPGPAPATVAYGHPVSPSHGYTAAASTALAGVVGPSAPTNACTPSSPAAAVSPTAAARPHVMAIGARLSLGSDVSKHVTFVLYKPPAANAPAPVPTRVNRVLGATRVVVAMEDEDEEVEEQQQLTRQRAPQVGTCGVVKAAASRGTAIVTVDPGVSSDEESGGDDQAQRASCRQRGMSVEQPSPAPDSGSAEDDVSASPAPPPLESAPGSTSSTRWWMPAWIR